MQTLAQKGCGRRSTLILLAVVALAAVPAAVFGPTLLDYYRLDQALTAAAKQAEADAGPWPQLVTVCMPCHGPGGSPANANYAALAGLPASYLQQQLQAFASGARPNPWMTPLAADLSAQEMRSLADYFAVQPAAATGFVADAEPREAGRELVDSHGCSACHGAGFEGLDPYPRLAGQSFHYLVNQLVAYQSGARRDPSGVMGPLVAGFSAHDIDAMAQYLASLNSAPRNSQ